VRSREGKYRQALEYVERLIQQLPSGVDEEAREDDLSPDDMAAYIGGLILRSVREALGFRAEGK
jgi:hypothetical protein